MIGQLPDAAPREVAPKRSLREKDMGSFHSGPIASDVTFGPAGIAFEWSWASQERAYIGHFVSWEEVRDYDAGMWPPELRLRDGRTIFVSRVHANALRTAATQIGVPAIRRPKAWCALLAPFSGYLSECPTWRDGQLTTWGITARERKMIRFSFAVPITVFSRWDECAAFGQSEAVRVAYPCPKRWGLRTAGYCRFRRWTDEIADRPTQVIDRATQHAQLV